MDSIARASVDQALKILLSLAPLFAFWFISLGGTWAFLETGLVVGLALLIALGLAHLTRGTMLWGTAFFFAVAFVLVLGLQVPWVIHYLGLFPTTILFLAVLLSMVLGRPFIDEYARDQVSAEVRESASYVRTCYILTSYWAAVLLVMASVSLFQLYHPLGGPLGSAFLQLGIIGVALVFQAGYVVRVRRRRLASGEERTPLARPGRGHA